MNNEQENPRAFLRTQKLFNNQQGNNTLPQNNNEPPTHQEQVNNTQPQNEGEQSINQFLETNLPPRNEQQ